MQWLLDLWEANSDVAIRSHINLMTEVDIMHCTISMMDIPLEIILPHFHLYLSKRAKEEI